MIYAIPPCTFASEHRRYALHGTNVADIHEQSLRQFFARRAPHRIYISVDCRRSAVLYAGRRRRPRERFGQIDGRFCRFSCFERPRHFEIDKFGAAGHKQPLIRVYTEFRYYFARAQLCEIAGRQSVYKARTAVGTHYAFIRIGYIELQRFARPAVAEIRRVIYQESVHIRVRTALDLVYPHFEIEPQLVVLIRRRYHFGRNELYYLVVLDVSYIAYGLAVDLTGQA